MSDRSPFPSAAEIPVDLPVLPIGAEEPANPEQHDPGDGNTDVMHVSLSSDCNVKWPTKQQLDRPSTDRRID